MKKKIVFITLSLEGGGAEKILSRLVVNLYNEFDIVLVTFYRKGRYFDELLSLPGLEYHCINAEHGNTFSFAIRLRRIIKKASPDKILSFLYYPNIVTYLSQVGLSTTLIFSERSNHRLYLTNSFKHKIWNWILHMAYKKATSIITVSNESKAALASDFSLPNEKIHTIFNGLNFPLLDKLKNEQFTDFKTDDDVRNILAVGSINRAKNYPLLIESFSVLHSRNEGTRLIILGKGEMMNEINELITQLKLHEAVYMAGYCDNPYKYMKLASCYVLSSSWEGFPNSLLEAMYINGHVVSTDCPTGPSEIISHNEDGLLCEMNNSEDLATAMEKMCFDEDFRDYVFENSRRKIAKFDERIMIQEYREIILK
jgi:glycosyltransferase involved in cell wall biosynthesis